MHKCSQLDTVSMFGFSIYLHILYYDMKTLLVEICFFFWFEPITKNKELDF